MEKKETPQRNLRRFFVVGREPEKVTFRFAERNASFNFSGTFRFADYKTKDIIHNPISEEVLELIDYNPDKRGLVFPDFRDKLTQVPLKKWIKAAGITKHISFHCARHTFGCLQVEAGTNLMVIQRLMGHKNFSTTEIYAKMSDEQIRATVNCVKLK